MNVNNFTKKTIYKFLDSIETGNDYIKPLIDFLKIEQTKDEKNHMLFFYFLIVELNAQNLLVNKDTMQLVNKSV